MRNKLILALVALQVAFSYNLIGQESNSLNELRFNKHIIHGEFISEGVAVGDVNKDGLPDILAGSFWFEAPGWVVHEIREPKVFDYKTGYSDSFLNFTLDVNNDGWLDFISFDFPGTGVYWFENPKGKERHWTRYTIDTAACNESPMVADVDNDGRMDLVFGSGNKEMTWFRAPLNGGTNWERHTISTEDAPGSSRFSHGLGFGDIDNDNRNDIITTQGWWTTPDNLSKTPWKFNEIDLGEACSQMYVYDFDQDGDQDVISASAHDYGIWWHQQGKDDQGMITFKEHLITKSFSQTHGVAFEDMNGDGLPDLITGKRYFAHQGKDPGGLEPAVLYWFEFKKDANDQPVWVPHLIDKNSGVGLQVVVYDMNQDAKKDIIISNKKGVILFEGK